MSKKISRLFVVILAFIMIFENISYDKPVYASDEQSDVSTLQEDLYDYNHSGDLVFFNNKYLMDFAGSSGRINAKYYYINGADKVTYNPAPTLANPTPSVPASIYDYSAIYPRREAEKLQPSRADSNIEFNETVKVPCYMNINLDVGTRSIYGPRYLTDYDKPYFLIRGTIRVDDAKSDTIHLAQLLIPGNKPYDMLNIDTNGSAIALDGSTIHTVVNNTPFDFAIAFDINNKSADYYINNQLVKSGVSTSRISKISDISDVRIQKEVGSSFMSVISYEILAMQNAYETDDSNKASIFGDDSVFKAFLTDKTAFHAFSGTVARGDNKVKYSELNTICPIYEENIVMDDEGNEDRTKGELYIPYEMLQAGYDQVSNVVQDTDDMSISGQNGLYIKAGQSEFSFNSKTYYFSADKLPKFENGKVMIPIKEFASKALNFNVVDDGYGMVITSANTIDLDISKEKHEYMRGSEYILPTDVKALNMYLFFERPSANTIQEYYDKDTTDSSGHPFIMAKKSEFDYLRDVYSGRVQNPTLKDWITTQLSKADAIPETLLTYKYTDEGLQTIAMTRDFKERVVNLAFAYQITKTDDVQKANSYLNRAWREISNQMTFPDWNPTHIIDVGELLIAYAIAYDWMYDGLTEEQRDDMYATVKREGLSPVSDAYYGRFQSQFTKWKSNFNVVANGGAIAAALAFADNSRTSEDRAFCFDTVEKGLRSLEYGLLGFVPDGAWFESIAYWDYTVKFLSYSVGSLISKCGTDFGYLDYQGIDKTALFAIAMDSYQGTNNLHDCGHDGQLRYTSGALSWLAQAFDEPAYFAYRKKQISSANTDADIDDIIRYDTSVSDSQLDSILSSFDKSYITKGGLQTVTVREDYNDTNGMYFSAHGGAVDGYHTHYDVGSFVFDIMGHRWARDIGAEDYSIENAAASTSGWQRSYRRRAESHNVMVINPTTANNDAGQLLSGFAPMTDFQQNDSSAFAVYNMKYPYKNDVSDYKRGFYVGDNLRSLTVRDEISLIKASNTLYWFMDTQAKVEIVDNNTAILTQGGDKLKLQFITSVPGKLLVGSAQPLGHGEYSTDVGPAYLANQAKNYSDYRIQYKFTNVSSDVPVTITAKLSPIGEQASETPVMDIPISSWTLDDLPIQPSIEYHSADAAILNTDYVNDFASTNKFVYPNMVTYPKNNSITLNLQKGEDNRENNDIEFIMKSSPDQDCYIDVHNTGANKRRYFLIKGKAKVSGGTMGFLTFATLRDNSSTPYFAGSYNARPSDTAPLVSQNGILWLKQEGAKGTPDVYLKQVSNDEWFEFAMCFDNLTQTSNTYINGEQIMESNAVNRPWQADKTEFKDKIHQINLSRLGITGNFDRTQKLTIRDYEVLEMDNPYNPSALNNGNKSIFPDDSELQAFLNDKVAFHAYSNVISVNGTKYNSTIPFKWDSTHNELFVPPEMLELGYGISGSVEGESLKGSQLEITAKNKTVTFEGKEYTLDIEPIYENGTVMIPLNTFASKCLNLNVFNDNNGMVITKNGDIGLYNDNEISDTLINTVGMYPHSFIKSLNWYMFFERPKASDIMTLFDQKTKNAAHPYIMADKEKFDSIKTSTDETIVKWKNEIIKQADDICKQNSTIVYKRTDNKLSEVSKEFLHRMQTLGFAFQMTGNTAYSDRAYQEYIAAGSFPDWNSSYTYDTGDMLLACAIGYDWMSSAYSTEQKNNMFKIVKDMGLKVAQDAYYGRTYLNFPMWKSDVNGVMNAGVIAAALAFADGTRTEEEKNLCFDTAEKALRSLEYSVIGFNEDGSRPKDAGIKIDGIPEKATADGFANLMSAMSKGISILESSLGTDFNMSKYRGFSNAGEWYLGLDTTASNADSLMWLSKTYGKPQLAAYRKNELTNQISKVDVNDIIFYCEDQPDLYVSSINAFVNNTPVTDTFTKGNMTFNLDISSKINDVPVIAVLSQYKENRLIGIVVDTKVINSDGDNAMQLNYSVAEDTDTTLKLFLFNQNTLEPLFMKQFSYSQQ